MTTAPAAPPAAAATPPADPPAADEPGWRFLDTAGIIAGLLLVLIIADIWSDGRLISRRLSRKPQEGVPDAQPAGD